MSATSGRMDTVRAILGRVRAWPIALGIGVATAVLTLLIHEQSHYWRTTLIEMAEVKVLDAKFSYRGRVDIDPSVVIAAGDEKAVEKFGVWGSWDRDVFARVITNLRAAGADVVAFDMVFADKPGIGQGPAEEVDEKVRQNPMSEQLVRLQAAIKANDEKAEEVLAGLLTQAKDVEATVARARGGTKSLEEAFAEHTSNVVQGYIANPSRTDDITASRADEDIEKLDVFTIEEYGFSWLEDVSAAAQAAGAERVVARLKPHEGGKPSDLKFVPEVGGGFVVPLDEYIDAADNAGFFNADPDPDGVMRRLPLIFRYKEKLIPSLALSAAALHFGATPLLLADPAVPNGLAAVGFAAEAGIKVEVPVEHSGALLINYAGPSKRYDVRDPKEERGVFRYISLADIYDNDFDHDLVKRKVVFIAVTAIGTYDQRVTPFNPIVPGVEVHAAAVQSMVSGTALSRPGKHVQIEMALSILLALFLGFVLARLPIFAGSIVVVCVSLGWVIVDAEILFRNNLWFHQVPLQLQIILTWAAITLQGYLTEGREKAQLKKEFSTVLAPTVVDELLKNPELAGLGGDERVMTVMFSDIRGFTSMSEQMTPEGLTQFLNEYLTPMTDILIEHKGTLDKYMGDAIMAFWGAPIEQEDHAVRACHAAVDMMDELNRLQAKWRSEGKPEIDIGIGLNSGMMRVGFMGSARMRNYTLLGDNVNLGSRLEGINKSYGTNIIISESTMELCKGRVYGRRIDAVRVKGKREPVVIYELRGKETPPPDEKEFIDTFEAALDAYRAKKFEEAKATFETLAKEHDDKTSAIYVERCNRFLEDPPPDNWDGVYEMKTK